MSRQRPRLEWLRRRSALLLAVFFFVDAGVAAIACSSSSAPGFDTPDATTDDEGGLKDGGLDSNTPNGDTGPQGGGHCPPDGSPVTSSPCDVVLQDCPKDSKGNTQECVVNGTASECVALQASEQLSIGKACCSNNSSGNPCSPGLTCVGNPCVDGGPISGRCSPACCDDKVCGKSDPEGITGSCDLTIVNDTQTPLYNVCSYRLRCQPFGVEPCTNGQGCEIDDSQGTATCIDTSGKTNRQSCSFKNDCADGYICFGGGATGLCHYMCLLPNTVSPFDAGLVEAGAGKGGCPAGEACTVSFMDAPAWLGACALPDGG